MLFPYPLHICSYPIVYRFRMTMAECSSYWYLVFNLGNRLSRCIRRNIAFTISVAHHAKTLHYASTNWPFY